MRLVVEYPKNRTHGCPADRELRHSSWQTLEGFPPTGAEGVAPRKRLSRLLLTIRPVTELVSCLVVAQWLEAPMAAWPDMVNVKGNSAATPGRCNGQPYRRASASLKAPLWRANPKLLMGRVDSQDDVPFSWAAWAQRCCFGGRSRRTFSASFSQSNRCLLLMAPLIVAWSLLAAAMLACNSWQSMRLHSGFQSATDDWCRTVGKVVGLTIPMPPSRTARARSARVLPFGVGWPVKAGISFWSTSSSRGFRRLSSTGVVTLREVTHRLMRPCVYAA